MYLKEEVLFQSGLSSEVDTIDLNDFSLSLRLKDTMRHLSPRRREQIENFLIQKTADMVELLELG